LAALRRISQAIDVWSRTLWRDYGLTAPQLATLREILSGKNVSPVALAIELHLSQPTVTGILNRLEKRGLIKRRRSNTDGRSIVAIATERGIVLAERAPPLLRDRFRQELEKEPEWRQSELLAALQHVAAMLQAPETVEAPFLSMRKDESAGEVRHGKGDRRRRTKKRHRVRAG
jgi:DNA-binding MarR family transcriptional regulator